MMRYAVTVFDCNGRTDTRLNLDHAEALKLAENRRPALGASYVHDETRRLVFKPYRMSSPALRPPCPRPRRLNAVQREAAARRFELDGEHDNAASMRALI